MSATITFTCSGCPAKSDPIEAKARFESIFKGDAHGWGVWKTAAIADLAPDGWVAFDPFTGMTYCKECWASIISDEPEASR